MTYFKGLAMPPTPCLGSGASFQGPGPLPMASARQAIGISLIESFWRSIFCRNPAMFMISVISGDHGFCRGELVAEKGLGEHGFCQGWLC